MNTWNDAQTSQPDENEVVLVYIHTWYVSWFKDGVYYDEEGIDSYSGVTHWMRPQRPK